MRTALVLLGLALVGSLLFAYAQYRKAQRWTGSKVEYEYDIPRDLTIMRLKADGRLLDVGYDRNSDLENDSVVFYAANGQVCSIWVDEDFNGIFEVVYTYDPEERLVGRSEDIGQDGYFDEYIRYTTDSVFVYRDANLDLWYEDHELVRKAAR